MTNNEIKNNKVNNSAKVLILDAVFTAILIFVDQLTKIMCTSLKDSGPVVLINNVLELHYLENRGAAFGILQGQRVIFLIISIVVLVIMSMVYIRIPAEKKYVSLNIIMDFILAGALGNTIDRVMLGYVRDFIYFSLINFPIFNVADIYVSVATVLLAVYIIFVIEENDFKEIEASIKAPFSKKNGEEE